MAVCNSQSFIHADPSNLIFKNSLPMVGAILALLAYDLLESSLLAAQPQHVLTSFGFTLPITAAMTALAIALSIRTNNKIIRQNCIDKQQVPLEISNCLLKNSLIVFLFSLLFYFNQEALLLLTGNSQQLPGALTHSIAKQQQTYLDLRFIGWVFLAVIWMINATLRALGWMPLASALMFCWATTKCILAIVLLSPESNNEISLSVVAWLHIATDVCFAVISLYFLHQKVGLKKPSLTRLSIRLITSSKDSCLIVLQQFITPISMAFLTYMAATFDTSYVAALALIFRLELLFLLIPMVLTTSLPALVGANFWREQHSRVEQFYGITFGFIMLFQLLLAALLLNQHHLLSNFICSHQAISNHLFTFLTWVPWAYGATGILMVFQSCLNAKNKTLEATVLAISHKLVLLLSFAFIGASYWDKQGFYLGIALSHAASLFIVYLIMKRTRTTISFKR